ncbi:hypothetical protein EYF80_001843 [Liparis tanakae]|uniref:Uncharacterized protein n=1 Tax=Liparis tanakae TaxID=230148 RepID=A0A4Z2JCD3_9TELE|nr:hypothetical protein EYF80_001843 [Liparis tanakae]
MLKRKTKQREQEQSVIITSSVACKPRPSEHSVHRPPEEASAEEQRREENAHDERRPDSGARGGELVKRNRRQHPLSLSGVSPSSPELQQPPQRRSGNMLQAHKSKNLKVSQSSNPWAATCATSA